MMRRNLCNMALIGGVLLLSVACSSDDSDVLPLSSQSIRFAVSPATHTDGETRAVLNGSYLPAVDVVGLFAYSYTSSSDWLTKPDIFENEEGTVEEPRIVMVGELETMIQAITLPEKYYVAGHKHAFYSYYPYRSSLKADSPILTADLFSTLETDGTQTDWLWATPMMDVVASASPVQLTYLHVMTLVRIAVAKKTEVTATLKIENVSLTTSSSQKFTFDVSSGEVESVLGGATQYTESLVSLNEGVEEHYVISVLEDGKTLATENQVASQILLLPASDIKHLSFRINGEDFSTPDGWTGFSTTTGGKFRFVSIVVGVNEITIQLGGKDWEDDDDIDLTNGEVTISVGAKGWDYDPATDIDMTQSGITISLGAKGWTDYEKPIDLTN